MAKYEVDVKAFFTVYVEAESEEAARKAADEYIESVMEANEDTAIGYNQGIGPDQASTIIPRLSAAAVDGDSEVSDYDDIDE